MNIQPKKPGKPDALGRLFQLWGLTPTNEALARSYLTDDQADESLLSGAEQQIFPRFDWQDQQEICSLLRAVTAPNGTNNQAKVLRLLWAIGRSTAGFAALFDQQELYEVSDSAFRQRCQVLGTAAAAAMGAEKSPLHTTRLHQLARTDPDTLLEAQRLIADPQNSMAGGVLAGVLLAAGPKETTADTPLAQQVELVLNRVDAVLNGTDGLPLPAGDISQLQAYIQAGDPTVPVPATSIATVWQLPAEDYLSRSLGHHFAVQCIAPAVLFGLLYDARLACAMRVLIGFEPCGVLQGVLCFLSEDWDIRALDALIPHIPGGAVTLLRFAVTDFYKYHEETVQKLARHFCAAGEETLNYLNLEGYDRLCGLLPELKHSKDSEWMEQLHGVILSFMDKVFRQRPEQAIVHDYLTGQGALADSAAILKPIRNEYRYLSNIGEALEAYQKLAGWDAFACRCVVLFCFTCTGYGTANAFPMDEGKKRHMDAFVDALLAGGLPVRDCVTILAILQETWYQQSAKELIDETVQEHFITPAGLEALADAALHSSAAARIMAVKGLDALSNRPDCAEGAHKALIACAGDTSKQVQTVLVSCFIRHPDWESDYLTMLGSKKTAQRSLASRVLAGIGVEKYRAALESALAVEKNAKVLDQITTLLGTPAVSSMDGQSPAELAAQVLKGGKKRRVQWLLEHPLPKVHCTDAAHTEASEDQIAALFVAYADLGRMGRSSTAAAIAADLEPQDLEALACEVWDVWMKAGAQSKTKWVLSFAAAFGGAAMTAKFLHAISEWPQSARGAIACEAVAALSVSPDPAALVAVDSISRKFKFRQIKAAAAAALENAAQELGITVEELADRIVPTLDFAPDGTRVFDYGPRKFTVRLTPSLELVVTTEAGKAVKSMPAPGKTDDAEKAAAAYAAYKTLKKQIKTTITAQRARLELALSAQRCWDGEAWRKLFVENPVMHQFAISLIWGVYENGELKETFRYMEDGSFNTVEEEEYTLPDGANIGLVHPIELEADTLAAWKQQLEDYEIIQSIDQLSRPVYRLPAEQEQATALETVAGRVLNSLSLMGKLQGMGWYRGSVVDGGGFYTFYREDPSVGIGVELNFSGSYVGGDNEDVTVFDAVFYKAGTVEHGSYCYDIPKQENVFPLGQVPARYYSEVVWQLERATASSTEFDPDWQNTKN